MLPLSSTNKSKGVAFVRSSLRCNCFCVLLLPPTIEGEDCSFLRHRQTHLKLPLHTTSSFVVVVVIVVGSFCHRYCYRS
ncbi:hypothetical protein BHE74_00037225 [Ensete ventricosum]|nr:hypothetical protein BHE74_00037225 [Ensete ventricosum]